MLPLCLLALLLADKRAHKRMTLASMNFSLERPHLLGERVSGIVHDALRLRSLRLRVLCVTLQGGLDVTKAITVRFLLHLEFSFR